LPPFDAIRVAELQATEMPDYMHEVYDWAYLNPRNVKLLDREFIVSLILWGNNRRLKQALLSEISPGATVLQAAHVYGTLISEIAANLDFPQQLEVVDVSSLQIRRCRDKLRAFPQVIFRVNDITALRSTPRDVVSCFFLLHEIPEDYKQAVVNRLLQHVAPGGKAVFVDYHKPCRHHPLRGIMNLIWLKLEPFAIGLVESEIETFAEDDDEFTWSKETYFGGLYQKVVATRRRPGLQSPGVRSVS